MKSLQTIYKCALIVLTIGMTLYCVQKYRLDHNVSLVDFKWFQNSKLDIYPSLSICLLDPISETKVDNQYGRVKKTMYKSYLSGYVLDEYLDQKYLEIDYANVAISVQDYLLDILIQLGNGTKMIYKTGKPFTWVYNKNEPSRKIDWIPERHTINVHPLKMCFVFDVPYIAKEPVDYVRISMNRSVFQSGSSRGFTTHLSYPNQLLRSAATSKIDWKWPTDKKNLKEIIAFDVNLDQIETINYRNLLSSPCHSDWLNDDENILRDMAWDIGCVPPYFRHDVDGPACTGQKQLIRWRDNLTRFHHTPSIKKMIPCRVIRSQRFTSKISTEAGNKKNVFYVVVRYPEYYMEIKHVRQYNFESLIGNAGGYLGLFLGYALLQLPACIAMAYSAARHALEKIIGSGKEYDVYEADISSKKNTEGCKNSEEGNLLKDITVMKKQLITMKHDVAIIKRQHCQHSF